MSGSLAQISWRCGLVGNSTPTVRASAGLKAPHAFLDDGDVCVRLAIFNLGGATHRGDACGECTFSTRIAGEDKDAKGFPWLGAAERVVVRHAGHRGSRFDLVNGGGGALQRIFTRRVERRLTVSRCNANGIALFSQLRDARLTTIDEHDEFRAGEHAEVRVRVAACDRDARPMGARRLCADAGVRCHCTKVLAGETTHGDLCDMRL